MRTFTVRIEAENAAFGDDGGWDQCREVVRILTRLKNDIGTLGPLLGDSGVLFDSNGNRVGDWSWTDAPG